MASTVIEKSFSHEILPYMLTKLSCSGDSISYLAVKSYLSKDQFKIYTNSYNTSSCCDIITMIRHGNIDGVNAVKEKYLSKLAECGADKMHDGYYEIHDGVVQSAMESDTYLWECFNNPANYFDNSNPIYTILRDGVGVIHPTTYKKLFENKLVAYDISKFIDAIISQPNGVDQEEDRKNVFSSVKTYETIEYLCSLVDPSEIRSYEKNFFQLIIDSPAYVNKPRLQYFEIYKLFLLFSILGVSSDEIDIDSHPLNRYYKTPLDTAREH